MIKRKLIILFISTLAVTLFMYGMIVFADRKNHEENPFVRLLPSHALENYHRIDLKYNSYYIAGATDNNIFLANYTSPFHLLVTDYTLSDTHHIKLPIPDTMKIAWKAIRISIDSPNVYILEGVTPKIIQATFPFKNPVFYTPKVFNPLSGIAISNSSFVYKIMDTAKNIKVMAREEFMPSTIKIVPEILEKQVDGNFCVDGLLQYDNVSKRLIYSYFYRNQFICLDTNLNILYKGKTIDTNSVAKIKVVEYEEKNTKVSKLGSPAKVVNLFSSVSNNKIFINSQLLAKNESKDRAGKASAIDIYSLENGGYLNSFYLQIQQTIKLSDFKTHGNNIIALNGQYLSTYTLSSTILSAHKK